MFLDETHIWPREDPRPPPRPRHPKERAIARVLLGYAFLLLLMPVSLGGMVDAIRYLVNLLG